MEVLGSNPCTKEIDFQKMIVLPLLIPAPYSPPKTANPRKIKVKFTTGFHAKVL